MLSLIKLLCLVCFNYLSFVTNLNDNVDNAGGSNTAGNDTPPSANQSGQRSGASTATIESQRHPNATPSCQSGISSGSRSPGSPRWNRHAIRNDIYRGGGVSKRVGPEAPNKT